MSCGGILIELTGHRGPGQIQRWTEMPEDAERHSLVVTISWVRTSCK